jgi:hypothetical protein
MIRVGNGPASWGFTRQKFTGDSYLWKTGDRIMVSFIVAKEQGKGNFSALVKAIEADGFKVAVPTPLGKMPSILQRWGFRPHYEVEPDLGETVEVWCR